MHVRDAAGPVNGTWIRREHVNLSHVHLFQFTEALAVPNETLSLQHAGLFPGFDDASCVWPIGPGNDRNYCSPRRDWNNQWRSSLSPSEKCKELDCLVKAKKDCEELISMEPDCRCAFMDYIEGALI